MMLRKLFMLITLAFFHINSVYSIENFEESQSLLKFTVLNQVLSADEDVIIDLQDDHLYLNPEKIIATQCGLVLNLKNSAKVILPTVYSDQKGCFIFCTQEDMYMAAQNEDDLTRWWCPACCRIRKLDKWNRCTACGRKL